MSTVYYPCGKCGNEIGSAQQITWLGDGPYHPECAREKELASLRQEANMKTYTIYRNNDSWKLISCYVDRPRGDTGSTAGVMEHGVRYNLFHLVYHSPDGFETGFGGAGPADLALSILADYFNERADIQPASGRMNCWVAHNDFKDEFIAHNKLEAGEEYTITEQQIAAWFVRRTSAKQT